MSVQDSLDGLRGIQLDLIALSEECLPNVERLWGQLEARIGEFRGLLNKTPKNDNSRNSVSSGSIRIDELDYNINDSFKENTIQLADVLDLDELDCARLLLDAQQDAEVLDRSHLTAAVIRFHERRQYLLECLRLILKVSSDPDSDEGIRDVLRQLIALILETKDGPARNGSLYANKCVDAMQSIEQWVQKLAEKLQSKDILEQPSSFEPQEILEFQQISLRRQHESLGAAIMYLIKANFTSVDDFHKFIDRTLPVLDEWNYLALHYVPATLAFISQYGSPEGSGSLEDARSLHRKIINNLQSRPWILRNLQAATTCWWIAEYSGWYLDQLTGSPAKHISPEAEARERSDYFFQALHEGALECTLSIASQIRMNECYDPVRYEIIQLLLPDNLTMSPETALTSTYLQELVLEQFETFADAFIANMPDTLRQLRVDEDDQRRKIYSGQLAGMNSSVQSTVSGHDLYLERFLVILSYSFEHRVDAAELFWSDPEGNLYGFLQWVSRRQSTPLTGAVCEMLRAISEGEACATLAHQFLLDEGTSIPARMRRTSSLSWSQILGELDFYTSRLRDHVAPTLTPTKYSGGPRSDQIIERESSTMLECYLRLMAHLCSQSSAVRAWIITHPTFRIFEVLFFLCGNTVPSRLKACSLIALEALLTDKDDEVCSYIWGQMDHWLAGPGLSPRAMKSSLSPGHVEDFRFGTILTTFDEYNAFVSLLARMVSSSSDDSVLNDVLPFPEQLGAAYRMPGVDPYIDFVLGRVFAAKTLNIDDPLQPSQLNILRWNCLTFVGTCLGSFNEDLVIIAKSSNLPVDTAMRTSSLQAYVQLHPFARTMEWMFNERVLAALFATVHQDVKEVSIASSDSPLVRSVTCSIEIMNLIMDLQITYLDIVRPQKKLQSSARREPIPHPSLASFEESVSNHLDVIVDISHYCGIGHQELATTSLQLLEKLARSRKLNIHSPSRVNSRFSSNRLIAKLQESNSTDAISRSLMPEMQFDERELGHGDTAPGYIIKLAILNFFSNSLSALFDKPTIAHLLLGFTCFDNSIDVDSNGLFSKGLSLFHSITRLIIDCPDYETDTVISWLACIKQKGLRILKSLWDSPQSSVYVLTELRDLGFLSSLFLGHFHMSVDTRWNGKTILEPDFNFEDSAIALEQLLLQRSLAFQYASAELRLVAREGVHSFKAKTISTLLGLVSLPSGEQLSCLNIFDLFDFMELEISDHVGFPELHYFAGIDIEISGRHIFGRDIVGYELKIVEELLVLRQGELRQAGRLQQGNEEQMQEEARALLLCCQAENHRRRLVLGRNEALKAWVELLTLVIEGSGLDQANKTALILQSLQTVLPRLEKAALDGKSEAFDIARLVRSLLYQLNFRSPSLEKGKAGDIANERLFQVFRIALRAISLPGSTPDFHEILYGICYHYLTGVAETPDAAMLRRQCVLAIKSAGERFVDIICDESYGGDNDCRLSALLLLNALVALGESEDSSFVMESLARANFIVILVETIEHIPQELARTNPADLGPLLAYFEGKLSLLLRISQTRLGAAAVMNAGLFQAIRTSGLFSVDPDLGLDIDNPDALKKYYGMLLSVLQVITAVVLSRGPQNEQTMEQATSFLAETRSTMVSVFKRQAKIGGVLNEEANIELNELVERFVLLVATTKFMNFEEQRDAQKTPSTKFS